MLAVFHVICLTGMCVTPNGKLCISDPGMKTVHVVTPEGRLESSFNTCLPPLKKGFDPMGLASNKEGEVFVCDWDNHLIRVFDQSGQECRRFGGRDEEPGKLCNPCDLAVTPDGKVLVADKGNHRIQVRCYRAIKTFSYKINIFPNCLSVGSQLSFLPICHIVVYLFSFFLPFYRFLSLLFCLTEMY